REIVLKVGQVMSESHPGSPVSPIVGHEPELTVTANSVFERITPEELWACTSCKACDEICPVNIEILDKILDMPRYLSLMSRTSRPSWATLTGRWRTSPTRGG